MKKKNLYITLTLLALYFYDTFAQNRTYEGPNKMNTWSITGYGGISRFFGDLNQYDFKRGDKVNVHGGVRSYLSTSSCLLFLGYNLRLGMVAWLAPKRNVVSSITGNSQDVYFKSPSFVQASLDGTVNLNRLLFGFNKLRRWKFDAHAGVGVIYFHTDVYDLNTDQATYFPATRRVAPEPQVPGSAMAPFTPVNG